MCVSACEWLCDGRPFQNFSVLRDGGQLSSGQGHKGRRRWGAVQIPVGIGTQAAETIILEITAGR